MKEIEKSLRVFFGIIALLLFSQVIGTGLAGGNILLLIFSGVIILSGILGFFNQLDKVVIILDIIILIGIIISWVILGGAWPLYLMYILYAVVQSIMCWYWNKHRIDNDEEDAS